MSLRIAIAAGGTGGHMVPAHALDIELKRRGHETLLITDKRGAAVPGLFAGTETYALEAGRMSGGMITRARAVTRMAGNLARARSILRRAAPAAAIGFGGYPALPALAAARLLGLPACLHEQNAVLGRVNRLLARRAARIALSFEDTLKVPAAARGRTAVTGNPVRADVARLAEQPYPKLDDEHMMRILVVGGSLGARILADVVPDALALLPAHLKARLQVTQQCRADDLDRVRTRYVSAGIAHELAVYLEDLPERLLWTHLVIGRAGASTLAELSAAGRPAILVPLPIATDDHQTANARRFIAGGAGWLMAQPDFTAPSLAKRLQKLALEPQRLRAAAGAALALGRPQAASALADLVEAAALAERPGTRPGRPDSDSSRPQADRREALL